jgi:hypothetical protein
MGKILRSTLPVEIRARTLAMPYIPATPFEITACDVKRGARRNAAGRGIGLEVPLWRFKSSNGRCGSG